MCIIIPSSISSLGILALGGGSRAAVAVSLSAELRPPLTVVRSTHTTRRVWNRLEELQSPHTAANHRRQTDRRTDTRTLRMKLFVMKLRQEGDDSDVKQIRWNKFNVNQTFGETLVHFHLITKWTKLLLAFPSSRNNPCRDFLTNDDPMARRVALWLADVINRIIESLWSSIQMRSLDVLLSRCFTVPKSAR